MFRTYLGDGVYVAVEPALDSVKLTTETGDPTRPDNTIFLEPGVMLALLMWWQGLQTAGAPTPTTLDEASEGQTDEG